MILATSFIGLWLLYGSSGKLDSLALRVERLVETIGLDLEGTGADLLVEQKIDLGSGVPFDGESEAFEYKDQLGTTHNFEAARESWIVVQSRGQFGNPDDYFVRNWTQYENGFGVRASDHLQCTCSAAFATKQ